MSRIYLKPVGGLCNRIRAIDSVIPIAKAAGKQLIVVWEKNKFLHCSWTDLFQPSSAFEIIETRPVGGISFPFFPTRSPSNWARRLLFQMTDSRYQLSETLFYDDLDSMLQPLYPITPKKYPSAAAYEQATYPALSQLTEQLSATGNCYLASCWRLACSPRYQQNFVPVDSVLQQVDHLTRHFSNTYGLHIRGTDAHDARRYSPVGAFEQTIDQLIQQQFDATFFLASDEPTVKQRLLQRYGNRILQFEQQDYRRGQSANIHNALIDLLCLSQTQGIYGSYLSSFSQIAGEWTGNPVTTVMKRDGPEESC